MRELSYGVPHSSCVLDDFPSINESEVAFCAGLSLAMRAVR